MIHVMKRVRPHPERDTELRIGVSLGLPAVLRSLGADPADLLAEVGFDVALFDNPENRISFRERGDLFAHCAAKTRCQHLGLLVGQQAGLHSLGLTGLLAKYSPDVGTALRNLTNYMYLQVRGAITSLSVDGRSATLSYSIIQAGVQGNDQVGDGAVAVTYNIIRSLCGPGWQPSKVLFAHREPEDIRPFQQFFRVPLVFDATQNAVVFSANWLNLQLPQADTEVFDMLQREVGALDARYNDSFPENVRRVLSAAIMTGQAKEDRIAKLFAMHSRTLRRRLREFETSFDELLDETRYAIAQRLLEDTGMPVSEIASALGYTDPSSFTRAFRRWSGSTPSRWRGECRKLWRKQR